MTKKQKDDEKMKKEMIKLGTIQNKSGLLVVSDPAYIGHEDDAWLQKEFKTDSTEKQFEVFVQLNDEGEWGVRVAKQIVNFYSEERIDQVKTKEVISMLGVDSGQMMFADKENIRKEWIQETTEISGVKMWGQADKYILEELKALYPNVKTRDYVLFYETEDVEAAQIFKKTVQKLSKEKEMTIVGGLRKKDTYTMLSNLTLETKVKSGILKDKKGENGLFSVSGTGFGDGFYPLMIRNGTLKNGKEVVLGLEIVFIEEN